MEYASAVLRDLLHLSRFASREICCISLQQRNAADLCIEDPFFFYNANLCFASHATAELGRYAQSHICCRESLLHLSRDAADLSRSAAADRRDAADLSDSREPMQRISGCCREISNELQR
jgi:hypothetical protein